MDEKPTYEELVEVLHLMKRDMHEAVLKMNWARSPLDANAISLLNQGFIQIDRISPRLPPPIGLEK